MNRRHFLRNCAFTAEGIALSGQLSHLAYAAGKAERPNILWIIAEDLSPDLGCYGNRIVKTPNIDKLAAEGARYTRAFATAPVCSASRSAIMTGMYQTTIGVHQHRTKELDGLKPLPGNVKVLTDYFRAGGYFTCNASVRRVQGNWTRKGKNDFNFIAPNPFDGTDWRQCKEGQPFFAQTQCFEVHRDHRTGLFTRDAENPIDPDKVELPPYYPDYPITRRDWADYLEYIQIFDRKLGEILKRLEDDGLADNTIVVFFGDHGRAHARDKQFLYEGGIHVPLIIRWPGHIEPGTVVDDLVSLIDLGPTCLKLAGLEPPSHMEGRDFMGPDANKRQYIVAARDRCDETYDRIRCIRTNRFKYIRNFFPNRPYMQFNSYRKCNYPVWTLIEILHVMGKLTPEQAQFAGPSRPAEELYDLLNDPHEVRNLAGDPKYQTDLERLRATLDKWIKATGDKGEISEDQQLTAKRFMDRQSPVWARWMNMRGLSPDIAPMDYLKYWEKELGVAPTFE